jgi:hypothetical protein
LKCVENAENLYKLYKMAKEKRTKKEPIWQVVQDANGKYHKRICAYEDVEYEVEVEDKKEESGMTPAALLAVMNGDVDNIIAATTPGGIERQEAQGQKDLVESAMLPKKLNCYHDDYRDKDAIFFYEKWGCKIKKDIDDLFVEVELPEGWKKQATDHSMWSHLLDENGLKRASIFYKAAFYDRDSFLSPETRFHVSYEMEDWRVEGLDYYDKISKEVKYGVIKQGDVVVYTTEGESFLEPYPIPLEERLEKEQRGERSVPDGHYEWHKKRENWQETLTGKAKAVLVAKFPKYEDYFEYWDVKNVKF